jgi:phosphatidylethanolamine-binding protein (PEBP) family uncharacterized protein
VNIQGGRSHFSKSHDKLLQTAPTITWEDISRLYTVVLVDPDAPERSVDGSEPAQWGPWLHAIWTDCKGSLENGKQVVEYNGPAPPRGTHRYIFVQLEQVGDKEVTVPSTSRKSWDFRGFLESNPHLEARAINFFYCDAR